MKKIVLFLNLICLISLLYGQNTSITNNNTIIIQGNVYYFQPSNTPSSPQPSVQGRNSINPGSWYGENAAKAWASISDWVIERCGDSTSPIRPNRGGRVYISQVHAYKGNTPEAELHTFGASFNFILLGRGLWPYDGVSIYYWVVDDGDSMENGRREKRHFCFF